MDKDRCVTCGSKIDDPYECVNWLIWKGAPVPDERNEIIRKIMDGEIYLPDLVIRPCP
ncbi:hypothetical protein LCGC14_0572960 [marine sediment metagenome]|uniref:Uncharacterized protein n=1 Tax=marine sediment metagenome TaxID=412755 RepID=A0A0F9RIT6_9ZZZZ